MLKYYEAVLVGHTMNQPPGFLTLMSLATIKRRINKFHRIKYGHQGIKFYQTLKLKNYSH